ncbi:MAG TPA: ATP-dependent DNA helicase RecG [Longimicrobiales bacterium]|nr:ATP-dependent DNA helicase RecG [Longimicrobiales bacterium]
MSREGERAAARSVGPLDGPVQFLKGVGPRRAEQLDRLGIRTVRDLLLHAPRRYEDASTVAPIGSLEVGDDATVIGVVVSKGVIPTRRGLRIFQAVLRDDSGLIECSWPGQPFLDRTIRAGDTLLASGPVRFYNGRQLQPREFVVLGRAGEATDAEGRVLPIYPSTEGVSQRLMRRLVADALDRFAGALASEEAFGADDLAAARVPPLAEAVELLHRPPSIAEAERGRRRLAWGEAFFVQLLHARAYERIRATRSGQAHERVSGGHVDSLYRALPFPLTDAQTRAVREIFDDLASERRMHRLLQGDVGSGKTVVALFAMLAVVDAGRQAALMAPTEILAEQHARTLATLCEPLGLTPALLTGRLSAGERRAALEALAEGTARLAVGTHALFQEAVTFADLGLAITDEQHRFGVRQRQALQALGEDVDALVMSATPIPRSLALTVYGDLDLSVLDEMPPGRTPVRTAVRGVRARADVYAFVREQVAAGAQAYIVYPLVEESEKVDLAAATEEYERLRGEVFADLRVALVHGRLPPAEKEEAMRRFAAGEVDILVATTVIEVGIDVPNASVMVVEHAERFGLSQLHQLRGRVGRGAESSYCVLIAAPGADGSERLEIMARTTDGFEIAREDLRIRGMGDFFGSRQHGAVDFRHLDPERDEDLLLRARDRARAIVREDPGLRRPEHAAFARILEARYGERERLFDVG